MLVQARKHASIAPGAQPAPSGARQGKGDSVYSSKQADALCCQCVAEVLMAMQKGLMVGSLAVGSKLEQHKRDPTPGHCDSSSRFCTEATSNDTNFLY